MAAWLEANGFDSIGQQVALPPAAGPGKFAGDRALARDAHRRASAQTQPPRRHLDAQAAVKGRRPSRLAVRRPRTPEQRGVVIGGESRGVYFSQDMIRRAAQAIRDCRSNDCIILARVALESALRHQGDLAELLPPLDRAPQLAALAAA
jgi:hypothetical protein